MSSTHNTHRKLIIGHYEDDTNKYDIYAIPGYVKLIIGDADGIEYEPRNPIYLAINITTGETTTFHTRDGKKPAEDFISGRENEFHLLECKIEEYLAGHDKIEPWITHKYIGTEFCSADRNCDMTEITTDLDIIIGDTVFVCPYLSKYRKQYYKEFGTRLPEFQVSKEKEFFTTRANDYDFRGLAQLIVN